ncbi:transcriptional co-activator [Lepidopterella palustris CBS 459.81]|uniref:Transcriptional co-activator n=1 Tax=Lepidopterella palustris CBS 459.81 TaxID=1314670 RepID=A0A8E2EH82_9PEZI|nr:transcriptional co-activator [Lepidopterella palustris CBS 459.81]
MAGTIRPDTIIVSPSTSLLSSKAPPITVPVVKQTGKPTVTAPRIDLEPLYTALKSAVGDADWAIYKESISLFVLGQLNQEELSRRIDPFICCDPNREHLHNQFIAAVYGNVVRDPPEPGVATWVSANDKPTTVTKPATGDEAERRLKTEVMQLPRRERKRLKAIQEVPFDMFTKTMSDYHNARQIKHPDTGPASAGGYNKTNWDLEIRKRYAQPLFSESNEFPDRETIEARMVPICYEEGLPSGCAPGAAEFMNIATETYIKEALSNFFGRVSSNGDAYIKTAAYKRQLEKEEDMALRGEVLRTPGGLLPVAVEAAGRRPPLSMEDLKLALELGDSYLGQVPLIAGQITNGGHLDVEFEGREVGDELARAPEKRNGAVGLTNGIGVSGATYLIDADAMVIDEADWGWQGGGDSELGDLDGVLDHCLAVGF